MAPHLSVTDTSTVSEVGVALGNVGITEEIQLIFKENQVDGFTLLELSESDLKEMLPGPGKVGIIRKLVVLLKSLKKTGTGDELETTIFPTLQLDLSSTSVMTNASPAHSSPKSSHASHMPVSLMQGIFILPSYSERIQSQLNQGNIIADFDKLVEETAYHLLGQGGISDRGAYQDFGRCMFGKYPCIGHPGKEPWTFFCSKLSQKIRNIRWRKKRRSEYEGAPTSKKARRSLNMAILAPNDETMSQEEASGHLLTQLQKPTAERDRALLKRVSRVTFQDRRSAISKLGDGAVEAILKEFPLLGEDYYIRQEFQTLLAKSDEAEDRFLSVMGELESILFPDQEPNEEEEGEMRDTERAIEIFTKLEKKLTPQRKNNIPAVITFIEASAADLETTSRSPPRLIMVRHASTFQGIVVADGISVPLEAENITTALIGLMACYYAWDLSFPKQYQLLLFLQLYVLEDKKCFGKRGALLTKFEKEFLLERQNNVESC